MDWLLFDREHCQNRSCDFPVILVPFRCFWCRSVPKSARGNVLSIGQKSLRLLGFLIRAAGLIGLHPFSAKWGCYRPIPRLEYYSKITAA